MLDRGMRIQGLGELQMPRGMILAEVRSLEQLLDQNHLRAAARGLADQFLGARDVRVAVPTAGHLSGRYRNLAHRVICYPIDGPGTQPRIHLRVRHLSDGCDACVARVTRGATHALRGWPWMDTQGLRGPGTAQRNGHPGLARSTECEAQCAATP